MPLSAEDLAEAPPFEYPDAIGASIAGEGPTDARTGFHRNGVWFGDEAGGDDAVTLAYTAAYSHPDGQGGTIHLDCSTFVTGDVMNGYGAEEVDHFYRRDETGEVVEWRHEDYSYDYASPLSYETVGEALATCRQVALVDWSFAISWNPYATPL